MLDQPAEIALHTAQYAYTKTQMMSLRKEFALICAGQATFLGSSPKLLMRCTRFDPASIAILDKLNQVLSRLDRLPSSPGQENGGLAAELSYAAVSTPSNPVPLAPRGTTDEAPVEVQDISRDDLSIPSARTTCEAVLQWPVLECSYPPNYIIDAVFETGIVDSDSEEEDEKESSNLSLLNKSRTHGFNEEDVLPLVQRFLDLVHTKNPVLEADTLWSYARRVAEDGLKWDSRSCMVLLACALGSVARSFPEGTSMPSPGATSSLKSQAESLHSGEVYYNLARRRFGLLQKGLLAPQCHFFAGVYMMYTLRPLLAWTQFHSASRSYHVYLQCQSRRTNSLTSGSGSARRRQLEQRLYWSCYKSECELRAEMDLPNSSLASFNYPDMHPSPPDMDTPSSDPVDQANQIAGHPPSVPGRLSASSIQQQEESWYYYLTEITLRRIANDILNEFYQNGHEGWNTETIGFMAQAARGFEQQLSDWYESIG
ncbi:C6 zinc finger domain-containing protein [Verticillium alfalfae VaMs.102]|uniref:C6 zinc finger domain-containing protein n=1 Tax=Verticillium alfalfae (strain VaMs.102 / ATCC MYA-4576 / FGSC 10136) TaxID=526221 RepID=C9SUB5_VERA1|nr:C6 zinc finger domain-containing protein [Verticillium alfalfae VaMs.102]EEY22426.1 C6 zinc finger domain-containing protein [Verticillium alfalfae VaMs.102]